MDSPRRAMKRKSGEENFVAGSLVWAKLEGYPCWPAMVVTGAVTGFMECSPTEHLVAWFGEEKVSKIRSGRIFSFKEYFNEKFQPNKAAKKYLYAVQECCQMVARYMQHDIDWDLERVIKWAIDGFRRADLRKEPTCNSVSGVPQDILDHLVKIKLNQASTPKKRKVHVDEAAHETARHTDNIPRLKSGELTISEVCLGCLALRGEDTFHDHPLFEGAICQQCKERLQATMFAVDQNGNHLYCSICGRATVDFTCQKCSRSCCITCIKDLDGEGQLESISSEEWECYMCADYTEANLVKRLNWREKLMTFYSSSDLAQPAPSFPIGQPARVLSLFDGIGTGLVALQNLNIKVEKYYASEIHADAINVVKLNHHVIVEHIGCVKELSFDAIDKLGPINLLLGGSPCNDLSFVNPARKGLFDLTGTGPLFFEFVRILHYLKKKNNGQIFWLFENVSAMSAEYKDAITRFLECQPVMIDAENFSPQQRSRLFWGNLPGIGRLTLPQTSPNMQSILLRGFDRTAVRDKLQTITTQTNSMLKGKEKTMPVMMGTEPSLLWVTEIEAAFGLPLHYTDIGNLNVQRRRELLGKAWSVQAIMHILTPLKDIFMRSPSCS